MRGEPQATGPDEDPSIETRAELLSAAAFYRRARARTGRVIPELEYLLKEQPYDPGPARALLDKYKDREYPYVSWFRGKPFWIEEGVFDPSLTRVSAFLANPSLRVLGMYPQWWSDTLTVFDRAAPGLRVLDAFSGCGVLGVLAALRGSRVVAFDASPQAVACAKINAGLHGVADLMEVRLGTLQESIMIGYEVFDLVIANPPLIPGVPGQGLEATLFDPEMRATIDLVRALPRILSQYGRCYLVTTDVLERSGYGLDLAALCQGCRLRMKTVACTHGELESYWVHEIKRRIMHLR
jgi:methylase of polypeptide subunit release factors